MSVKNAEPFLLLKGSVERLVFEYKALALENEELRKKVSELQKVNESAQLKVVDLERVNERVKLSEVLAGGNGDAGESKRRINDMVREIDRCIALLNNI